jgi:hypothetical protein
MKLLQCNSLIPLAFCLFAASACLADSAYVIAGNGHFGTLDLATGGFQEIGPTLPEGATGLAPGPNGSFLTLAVSGNLLSINPATGVTTLVGPTGLGDCSFPGSPCGPNSADNIVRFGNTFYATDLANNLYTVDPSTAAATLLGPTGIPPLPFVLLSTNPDGSVNVVDQTLFTSGGKLYATFDAATIDFSTFTITPVIPNSLYQIDPSTGMATLIAPTALNLTAAVDVSGKVYAFNGASNEVVALNLTNGNTTFVSSFDSSIGPISGASPVPEPSTYALIGIGLIAASICGRKRLLRV